MTPSEDDPDPIVPVSVRLGAVVPPEDPEDWTRPLTWVAAIGMVAAPAIALAWFVLTPPRDGAGPAGGTFAVAIALAAGAAAAGGTQLGRIRAVAGTLAAGLLAALLVVIAGAVTVGAATCGYLNPVCLPPTLAHAVAAALAGMAGVVLASVAAGLVAGRLSRLQRGALAAALGAIVAAAVLPNLF